jgi:excinuclease ABC subunit C
MPTRSDLQQGSGEFDSKDFLKQLTERPGVYRMYDGAGNILYVGKARNLKKRVSSYFRKTGLAPKTEALVGKIESIEVTITGSET